MHGKVAAGVAGDAEGEFAEDFARFGGGHIALADMGAIAAMGDGEVRAVVDEEGDIAGLHDGAQDVDGAADGFIVHLFQAELHRRDVTGVQRLCHRGGKGLQINPRWGDQIDSAFARFRLITRHGFRPYLDRFR